VQVGPIKSKLKPPGTKRLKVKYEELLLNVGFKFNLRRYNEAPGDADRTAVTVDECGFQVVAYTRSLQTST